MRRERRCGTSALARYCGASRAKNPQGSGGIGDLPEDGGEDDSVDRGVLVGKVGGVALGRDEV